VKDGFKDVRSELNAKLVLWKNLKSKKLKVAFVLLFIGLVGLKIFTTAVTFDWLTDLVKAI